MLHNDDNGLGKCFQSILLLILKNNQEDDIISHRLGENICKNTSDKVLLSKIHKEHTKLNKKNKLIEKWAKDLNRLLTKEDIQMADKLMKTSSMSYVIREVQIKTTMIYNYTPLRMACYGTLPTPNPGRYVEKQELSFIAGGNAKWYSHFRRHCGSFLQN